MNRLVDRVAIVTGAGSSSEVAGVGSATASLLAAEGCTVVVVDRDEAGAKRTVAQVSEEGGSAMCVAADVTIETECAAAVRKIADELGAISILVNNAAITGSASGIEQIGSAEWDLVMAVNVKGAMLMTRQVVPHMTGGGSIVNISSGSSIRADSRNSAYAASKGALNALTLSVAAELGPRGIRANAVVPSGFWSAMNERQSIRTAEQVTAVRHQKAQATLLKSEGTAWDVAHAAVFLASDDSRWITGQLLEVDGGLHVVVHER